MILIITADDDEHADEVASVLTIRGIDWVRLDPADFPRSASFTVEFDRSGGIGGTIDVLADGGQTRTLVALQEIHAVWWRRPGRPEPHHSLAGSAAGAFVQQESAAALSDVWEMLDAPFVPTSPDRLALANRKGRQLSIAGMLGFELPPTIVTNDPDRFLDFYRNHHGDVITKRIGTGQRLAAADDETIVRYADPVRPRDLVHLQDVALCPFITQSRAEKLVELRVTVVGDRVFAAAIHSQAAHHTRLDWRRYDSARTPVEPFDLPAEVAERCRTLTSRLGLRYGAIDLVLTPDGRFVFLEINPNGQYLWIEHDTGLGITEAIADLLISEAASHETHPHIWEIAP